MSKASQQRTEKTLAELRTAVAGNNECADCGTSRPGWASWNLGIFLCVRCAQLHRSLGTDVSKVKSLTLDSWERHQVESMRVNGNTRSNARFVPDPRANPPPLDLDPSDRNSQMHRYLVQKYRNQAFVKRERGAEAKVQDKREERTSRGEQDPVSGSSGRTRQRGSPLPTPTVSVSTAPREGLGRSSSPSGMLAGASSISRSATAPLPDAARQAHRDRLESARKSTVLPTSPHTGVGGYNPFNRQMTASAQIPSSSSSTQYQAATPSIATAPGHLASPRAFSASPSAFSATPYGAPLTSGSLSTSLSPYAIPQSSASAYQPSKAVTPARTGGVWDDLAGLSLSSASAQPAHSAYGQSPAFTPLTPSNMPAPPSLPFASQSTQTNPFLRAMSPQQQQPQPQRSSFPSSAPSQQQQFSPASQAFAQQPQYQAFSQPAMAAGLPAAGQGAYTPAQEFASRNPFLAAQGLSPCSTALGGGSFQSAQPAFQQHAPHSFGSF